MYLDYAVSESLDVDTVGSHCLRTKTKIACVNEFRYCTVLVPEAISVKGINRHHGFSLC